MLLYINHINPERDSIDNIKLKFKDNLYKAEKFYIKIKEDLLIDFNLLKSLLLKLKEKDVIINKLANI